MLLFLLLKQKNVGFPHMMTYRVVLTVARGACCCLSFTTDSSLSATHPEEILTAGKMLNNTILS